MSVLTGMYLFQNSRFFMWQSDSVTFLDLGSSARLHPYCFFDGANVFGEYLPQIFIPQSDNMNLGIRSLF
jgi:hypothetical protein